MRAAPRRKFSVLATLASAEVLGGGLLAAALRDLHPCVGLVAAAPGFLEAVPDLCGDGVGGKMGQQQLSGGEGPLEILDLLDCLVGLHEFSVLLKALDQLSQELSILSADRELV